MIPKAVDRQISVLLVDDEPETCKFLTRLLAKTGYEASYTTSGTQAVEQIRKGRAPDIILLDIMMPGLDGIGTLEQIRDIDDTVIVIMLTASDNFDVALESIKKGAYDFLRKPATIQEIQHSFEMALEKRNLLLENIEYQKKLEDKIFVQTGKIESMFFELKKANLDIVRTLVEAIDAKDPYTHGHCIRVAALTRKMGRALGLPSEKMEMLEYASLLHDIGKIGVDKSILHKPGALTAEELQTIREHPVVGAHIIQNIEFLKTAGSIVRHHHEFFNGAGYPDGLRGNQIDILVRIISVADAFDAMTSNRPYRNALSRNHALKILKQKKDEQFDPDLIDLFVSKKLYYID